MGKRPTLPADKNHQECNGPILPRPSHWIAFSNGGRHFLFGHDTALSHGVAVQNQVHSLTLAILYNMLVDMMLGIIPLWIGDLLDIFSRSYAKNYRLIVGFVEGDKEVIQEVNRKALLTAVGILVLCVIIYWVAKLAVYLTTALWTWISGLF